MNFFKNEWALFIDDMKGLYGAIKRVLTYEIELKLWSNKNLALNEGSKIEETVEEIEPSTEKYELDPVDHKVVKFLCEDVDGLRQQMTNTGTQLDGVKVYAEHFRDYKENEAMCSAAFQKYYDRHALKMAINEIPVEQIKIIQNHADVFIQGQEGFKEGSQFIDSRVDSIFEKAGRQEVCNMISMLEDEASDSKYEAERTFAEVVQSMVDTGVKVGRDGDLVEPFKAVLESKLSLVHEDLKNQDEWNDDYQKLLGEERKCLYALNKIEQHETEKQIKEFEKKLAEIDAMFE